MENLSSKEYLDRYEEEIQKEIDKGGLFEGATKERKNENTIHVQTKELWVFKITENEIIYLGNRSENPIPPNIADAKIKFEYNPPSEWSKEVKVTITSEAKGFYIEYTTKDPNDESGWKNYPNDGVTMTENGDIYARLSNQLEEKTGWEKGNVNNIERTEPTVNISLGEITSNSIAINVSAEDTPSGAYKYYLNGKLVPEATGNSYNFTGLNASTGYTIKVVVYDKAGNSAEKEINATTKSLNVEQSKGKRYPNTTTIQDSGGNQVKIPGGFTVSTESANNVADGVVIQNDSGDQFVWIPIRQASDLNANYNYPTNGYAAFSGQPYNVENWNQTGWSDVGVELVVQAGEFYVGRFEMGWANNRMVIRQGVDTYRSMSLNTALSQSGKVHKTSTARTTLMTGELWDAVMRFVNNKRAADGHTYNVSSQNNRCSLFSFNWFYRCR